MSLLPNTTYYFRVKAVNSNSESEYSDTIAVTTLSDSGGVVNPATANAPVIKKIEPLDKKCFIYLEIPSESEDIKEVKLTLSVNADYSNPIYSNLTYSTLENITYAEIDSDYFYIFELINLLASTTYYGKIKTVNKVSTSTETAFTFSTYSSVKPTTALGVTDLTAITARAQWTPVTGATSYVIDLATNSNFSGGSLILNAVDNGNQVYRDLTPLVENTTYFWFNYSFKRRINKQNN